MEEVETDELNQSQDEVRISSLVLGISITKFVDLGAPNQEKTCL